MNLPRDPRTIITRFMSETFNPPLPLDLDAPLIRAGILESVDLVDLLLFIERTFEIRVEKEEFHDGNFGNLNAIARYVERKLNGSRGGKR